MIGSILEPFAYQYMSRAIWVSALIGGACAFLSCYLILKGWSLMGDALAHAVVPGVALAYWLKWPYAAGAFLSGIIATLGMAAIRQQTLLREDVVIGVVFTSFFAVGLTVISINPAAVDIQTIVFGNILAISDDDLAQVVIIGVVVFGIMALKWKDLMLVFFDEAYARSIGLDPLRLKMLFFALLSGCTVAALQTVGAVLVIAMLITPGATAYLLTDRFGRMIAIATALGAASCATGAYLSFFVDGSTGGLIVMLQTALFLLAFVFAPRHGLLARRRAGRASEMAEA
jgi:manganese/iron transport system permease protein